MAIHEADRAASSADAEGLTTQVQQQVQQTAQDLKAQASETVRKQIDTRSTDAGDQFNSLASALRRAAEELEGDGKRMPADVARQAASRIGRASCRERVLTDV